LTDLVPDAIEPVVAWRAWYLRRSSEERRFRLESVLHRCLWPARQELSASCLTAGGEPAHGHVAPAYGCQCGVYGAAHVAAVASYVGGAHAAQTRPRAAGLVALWGHVLEHEWGWRASQAYPVHLWLPVRDVCGHAVPDWKVLASDLLDYGVPVEPVEGNDTTDIIVELQRAGQLARGRFRQAA
jgi:hypothetical protein